MTNARAYDRIIGASGTPPLVLEHFAEQFLHTLPADHERLATRRRRSIHTPIAPRVHRRAGPQVSLAFHAVQDGIERARAQSIAMSTELVDHRLAEDRTVRGVMKNVQPDEP
jgi:hypothetical protein